VLTITVFSERMVAKIVQTFWAALRRSEFITELPSWPGRTGRWVPGGWQLLAEFDRDGAAIQGSLSVLR
jgi:hypothetical protein